MAALIIFFSATQLGLHFWPQSSLVHGVRVDYLSPTLYFLDLLIVLYFFLGSFTHSIKILNSKLIISFLPILLLNLFFSHNLLSTLSWSLHLLLYLSFVLSLSPRIIHKSLIIIFPITILFQVALGAMQVTLGHTLQGPFYYLGERLLSVGTPTVAQASVGGQMFLRAYGTFSHPNVLAGWLVITLLIILRLRRPRPLHTIYYSLSTIIAACGVILTQSRSAALALFGLVIPFYLLRSLRFRLLYFFIVLCSLFIIQLSNALPHRLDLAVTDRLSLQSISLHTISRYPILGTGANASIPTYPSLAPNWRLLQPDHNSFTLFLSWFGLSGLLSLIVATRPLHESLYTISYILFPILPLLLLDHYLLTSPQGLFILLLYLRVVRLSDSPAH